MAVVALLAAVPLASGTDGLVVAGLLTALLVVLVVAEQLTATTAEPSRPGRSVALMGEIIEGLGPRERERIRALRSREAFFWIDVR